MRASYRPIVLLFIAISLLLASNQAEARRHRRHHRHHREPHVMPEKNLYERLGGHKAIESVMDDFWNRTINDSRLSASIKSIAESKSKSEHLREDLVAKLCNASGGNCSDSGSRLKGEIKALHWEQSQFLAAAEDLYDSMDAKNISEREKNEVLALVGSARDQFALTASPQ